MMKKMMGLHKVSYEKRQESIALAMADPLDPEVQRKIAEKVRCPILYTNRLLYCHAIQYCQP